MANNVTEIQLAVTNEGLESIIDSLVDASPITISTFRICNLGNTIWFNSIKQYKGLDPDVFYLPYSAADFQADRGINIINLYSYGIADINGFIPINSIIKDNAVTMEMDCYVPPTVGLSFQTNEIMLYTGSVGNYESFLYGIFPMITKDAKYGLNLRLILQL